MVEYQNVAPNFITFGYAMEVWLTLVTLLCRILMDFRGCNEQILLPFVSVCALA